MFISRHPLIYLYITNIYTSIRTLKANHMLPNFLASRHISHFSFFPQANWIPQTVGLLPHFHPVQLAYIPHTLFSQSPSPTPECSWQIGGAAHKTTKPHVKSVQAMIQLCFSFYVHVVHSCFTHTMFSFISFTTISHDNYRRFYIFYIVNCIHNQTNNY